MPKPKTLGPFKRFRMEVPIGADLCGDEPWFFNVLVFTKKVDMETWIVKEAKRIGAPSEELKVGADALCMGVLEIKGGKLSPCLGNLFFHEGKMGASIVVHELVHAALHTIRAGQAAVFLEQDPKDDLLGMTIDLANDEEMEEVFAHIVSDFTEFLVQRFAKLRLGPWREG